MLKTFLGLLGAIGGAIAGVYVAIGLLGVKRWIWPPGPMMMGDMESPMVALAGLLIGIGVGGFLGFRLSRRFSGSSDKLGVVSSVQQRLLGLCSLGVILIAVISILAFFSIAFSFSRWDRLEIGISGAAIWQAANIVAPFVGLILLARFNRRQAVPLGFVLLAELVMICVMIVIHWPGQYQMIDGGLPTGQPNHTYGLFLVLGCVLNWGLVFAAGALSLGFKFASRPRTLGDT